MHVGIDLAWGTRSRTGLAVVDDTGRLVASGVVRTDEEIDDWLAAHAPAPLVVAVDAPLVVPNETGQRVCERDIGRAFGRYGASAYPANRTNPLFRPPRGQALAQRHGWNLDPDAALDPDRAVCLEVYPHAALIGLFELPRRVLYKKGSDRGVGFGQLVGLLESVPELGLTESDRWHEIRRLVASPARGDLTRIEDELDAIVCAHVAWLWRHRRPLLHVYGAPALGTIVAPRPPTHPARRD